MGVEGGVGGYVVGVINVRNGQESCTDVINYCGAKVTLDLTC